MASRMTRLLAIPLGADGSLPTEIRLFVSGWNDSENGRFLFDTEAAKAVMAAYEKWGVDLSIDLEHQMFEGVPTEPTARDARGWFKLELRADGSLWATEVSWTPDGAARLTEKRQRYISPAFETDPKTKRITKVINAAITSIPATHQTPALVAASLTKLGAAMDPELVKKALDALAAGDAEGALSILKDMIATAAGGEVTATEEEAPADELAAEVTDEEEEPEEQAAVLAAASRLTRLTGKTTISAAVDEVETWRTSHLKLEAETEKLAKERAALEYSKRKENAITLTKMGAETPATTGLAKGKLCKRLLDEPLKEQNERVAALLAARGGKLPVEKTDGKGDDEATSTDGSKEFKTPHGVVTLSASEFEACAETGAKPEVYAANKAFLAHKRK